MLFHVHSFLRKKLRWLCLFLRGVVHAWLPQHEETLWHYLRSDVHHETGYWAEQTLNP
ncbi:hypothetical protein H253_4185 [Klebsiella pneumoniae KP-7]|nr:hypothetical protein H253_4185 [Klebsiella pneumoniae KP-7]EOZ69997.1 hypothetical protein H254_4067 [Klebsiella pneumoniae KP-11]